MLSKEKEVHGKWMTEERMKTSGEYSLCSGSIFLILYDHSQPAKQIDLIRERCIESRRKAQYPQHHILLPALPQCPRTVEFA